MTRQKISVIVVALASLFICIWLYNQEYLNAEDYSQKIKEFSSGEIDVDKFIEFSTIRISSLNESDTKLDKCVPLFMRGYVYYLRAGRKDLDSAQADIEGAISLVSPDDFDLLAQMYNSLAAVFTRKTRYSSLEMETGDYAKAAEAMTKSAEYEQNPIKRQQKLEAAEWFQLASKSVVSTVLWWDFFLGTDKAEIYKDARINVIGNMVRIDHTPDGKTRIILEDGIICELAESGAALESVPQQGDMVAFSGICHGMRNAVITLSNARFLYNASAFLRENAPTAIEIPPDSAAGLNPTEN